MDQFKKVIEEQMQLVKKIAEELETKENELKYLLYEYIVKYVIDRYKDELARNKELGVE